MWGFGAGEILSLHQGGGPESERKPALCNPRDSLPEWGPAEQLSKGPLIVGYWLMCECLEKEPAVVFYKQWLPRPLLLRCPLALPPAAVLEPKAGDNSGEPRGRTAQKKKAKAVSEVPTKHLP